MTLRDDSRPGMVVRGEGEWNIPEKEEADARLLIARSLSGKTLSDEQTARAATISAQYPREYESLYRQLAAQYGHRGNSVYGGEESIF